MKDADGNNFDVRYPKWVNPESNRMPINSDALTKWVMHGLPPAQGGLLKVEFQKVDGVTKTLKAIPLTATPEKFQGAVFDGDVCAARMAIAWSGDESIPATFEVTPETTATANEYYSKNEYPFTDPGDLNNFFLALCAAVKELLQPKQV